MQLLQPWEYNKVRLLFRPLDDSLAVSAILEGASLGNVYVDDATHIGLRSCGMTGERCCRKAFASNSSRPIS